MFQMYLPLSVREAAHGVGRAPHVDVRGLVFLRPGDEVVAGAADGADGRRGLGLEDGHVARDAALGRALIDDVRHGKARLRPGAPVVVDHDGDRLAGGERGLIRRAARRRPWWPRPSAAGWAWGSGSGVGTGVGVGVGEGVGVGASVGSGVGVARAIWLGLGVAWTVGGDADRDRHAGAHQDDHEAYGGDDRHRTARTKATNESQGSPKSHGPQPTTPPRPKG